MKTILLFLALTLAAVAAPITVDGNMNVITGGSNFGRCEDFITANPSRTGEVMLAIRAYHASVIDAVAVKQAAADAAAITARAKSDAADAACAQASALAVALVSKTDVSKLPDEVKAALATEADKQRAALAAQKADIEAKLAALP